MSFRNYLLFGIGVFFGTNAAFALEARDIYKLADPSIVVVVAEKGKETTQGSGVIVGQLEVVTSCHVISQSNRIIVKQRNVQRSAKLRFHDSARDLCQIRLDDGFPEGKPAENFVMSEDIEVGQAVYAIGSPRGLEHTLTRGIVSALRVQDGETARLIQTDTSVSPGSSGGGLFDSEAKLIGIISFGIKESAGLSFAIPANWIKELSIRNRDQYESNSRRSQTESPSTTPGPIDDGLEAFRVGNKWIYRLSEKRRNLGNLTIEIIGNQGSTVTERITRDGFASFIAERNVDKNFEFTRLQPTVYLPGGYQLIELAPYVPTAIDLKEGQTWESVPGEFHVIVRGRKSLLWTVTVLGRETVSVPAGKFSAWKVEAVTKTTWQGNHLTVRSTFWYSPETFRTVKVLLDMISTHQDATGTEVYELVSYKPTK